MPRAAEFKSVTLVTNSINITRYKVDQIEINTTCFIDLTVKNNILTNLVYDQGEVILSLLDNNRLEVLAARMTNNKPTGLPGDKIVSIPFNLTATNIGNNLWEVAAADVLAAKARLRLWGHVLLHDNFLFRIRAYVSCWLNVHVDYVYLPNPDLSVYLLRPPDEVKKCKRNLTSCEIWLNVIPTIHAKATVIEQDCEYALDIPGSVLGSKNHVIT